MGRAKPNSPKTPVISVPKPEHERVRVGKVGLMAGAGLAVGILWPKFAGFHLVPAPPTDSTPAAAAPSGSASAAATASSSAQSPEVPHPKSGVSEEPKPPGVTPPKVTLAQVLSCRSKDSERKTHCEAPAIESVIEDPLRALIACDGADTAHGILSLGFDVDFDGNKLENFVAGRSTTLASALAKRLVQCAEKELSKVSLEGIAHPMSTYRVFYKLEFAGESTAPADNTEPEKGPSTPTSDEVVAASGRVTVTWEAALIRAKPKDGEVTARVLGGTRLTVTGRQGDWYRVKYDAKGNEGWVFRGAIGL